MLDKVVPLKLVLVALGIGLALGFVYPYLLWLLLDVGIGLGLGIGRVYAFWGPGIVFLLTLVGIYYLLQPAKGNTP